MLKKVWKSLSGTKTIAGLIMVQYADSCGKWSGLVRIVGSVLVGGGAMHKVSKVVTGYKKEK